MAAIALDHITVVDATPAELAAVAAQTGCDGVCIFLHAMPDALPRLPDYDLVSDAQARRDVRAICHDLGLSIDLAYPFTLAGRTEIGDFAPAFEASAELGIPTINALLYDREPARRVERFAAFCDRARGFGLDVAVEFYPASQIKSLSDALELLSAAGQPNAGLNIDLLHHARSGGAVSDLERAPAGLCRFVQLSDGPAEMPEDRRLYEAGLQRMLPGAGALPIAAALAALPQHVRISVEAPQEEQILAGMSPLARAKRAVDAARNVLKR